MARDQRKWRKIDKQKRAEARAERKRKNKQKDSPYCDYATDSGHSSANGLDSR